MSNDSHGVQAGILAYQGNREHRSQFEGQDRSHSFKIPILGTGRVTVLCPFACVFLSPPIMSYGGHLAENEAELGEPPTFRAVVRSWRTIKRGDATDPAQRLWLAADVTWYVEGHSHQRLVGHVTFSGIAIAAPHGLSLDNASTTDDAI